MLRVVRVGGVIYAAHETLAGSMLMRYSVSKHSYAHRRHLDADDGRPIPFPIADTCADCTGYDDDDDVHWHHL